MFCCYVGLRENRRHPASYLVNGAKALNNAFRSWTRKEVTSYNLIYLKVSNYCYAYIVPKFPTLHKHTPTIVPVAALCNRQFVQLPKTQHRYNLQTWKHNTYFFHQKKKNQFVSVCYDINVVIFKPSAIFRHLDYLD